MSDLVRRHVRNAKTYFPSLQGAKTDLHNKLAWITGRPFDPDYVALRSLAGSRQLYLDVGANRGQSITAIRLLADTPHIVSFEPNRRLASILQAKFGMLPNVTVEPVGLGAKEGVFDLHIPSYRGYLFDGIASFDRDEAMSWLNEERLAGFDPKKLKCQTVSCTIRRLDGFELSPFFIKLDVQGFELQALMGGEATLRAHTPALLIEAPGQDIAEYLEQFGYRKYQYAGQRFSLGSSSGQNTFFLTEEKADRTATVHDKLRSQRCEPDRGRASVLWSS